MVFLVLLLLPLLIAAAGYFLSKGSVTRKELAVQVGVQAVVAIVSAVIVHYASVGDTEFWNGVVSRKASEDVPCTHSYQCNCRRDKNGRESCDTCYEHSYDVDWDVYTSNGDPVINEDTAAAFSTKKAGPISLTGAAPSGQ